MMPERTTSFLPIEQSCYWLADWFTVSWRAADGEYRGGCGYCRGGLTGLWTALAIKQLEPSTDVVVLEQEIVAYGASGRNAGMLAETIDHNHTLAIEHFGEEDAEAWRAWARRMWIR